jgi:hypothetical protein
MLVKYNLKLHLLLHVSVQFVGLCFVMLHSARFLQYTNSLYIRILTVPARLFYHICSTVVAKKNYYPCCVRLTASLPSASRVVKKIWKHRCLTSLWAFTACYRDGCANFTPLYPQIRVGITNIIFSPISS